MAKEEEISIDTSKIAEDVKGAAKDLNPKDFDDKLFEDEEKFEELQQDEKEKFKEKGKQEGASAWPLVIQLVIGCVMIVLFFGPAFSYVNPILQSVGLNFDLLRWPISFVVFDVMGIPVFLIAILMWDMYTKGGFVARTINFFERFPWFVDRLPLVDGKLAFLGTEYVGPLVSSFFDFVVKIITPPTSYLKIGILALAICNKVDGELVCGGINSVVNVFGKDLAVVWGIPPWIPMLLIIIWIIFSIVVSVPKFLNGLVVLIKVMTHFFFTVLKWVIEMLFKVVDWILKKILQLSTRWNLQGVVGFVKKLIEKLYLLLQKIITIIDKVSLYIINVVLGQIIGMLGDMINGVIKIPIIYFPVIVGRLLVLFFLIFFGINDLGLSIFAIGLLFTIDAVALSTGVPLIIGIIVTIIGAVMVGLL